jgi:hypothetical protein
VAAFFYDDQIKRFLLQFARIFSDWSVTYGFDQKGNPIYHRVPIIYGDSSRQVADVIAKNSASNMPSAPQIVYYISGIEFDQSRTQDPTFIDVQAVRQRAMNPETGEYETTQGNAFNIERPMPVPYTLRVTLEFWTSNTQQKLELREQLAALFNPSMEIMSTDNFLDWTSLSVVYQDGFTYSSRTQPVGTGNPIDVATWKFYMPIWISSPIKVRKFGVIQKIINTIYTGVAYNDIKDEDLLLGTRQKITPYGYKILLLDNQLQIIPANSAFSPSNDSFELPDIEPAAVFWHDVLNVYGVIRPGVSMIALENPFLATEIMGTINYDATNDSILIYDIDPDTLPQNTLDPVNSIIDPTQKTPGNGLPMAANGQRYLIVEDIPYQTAYTTSTQNSWIGLAQGASLNSIIEFNGTAWFVAFDAQAQQLDTVEFCTNLTSGVQYRFSTKLGWQKSYDGFYNQGDWRIII